MPETNSRRAIYSSKNFGEAEFKSSGRLQVCTNDWIKNTKEALLFDILYIRLVSLNALRQDYPQLLDLLMYLGPIIRKPDRF